MKYRRRPISSLLVGMAVFFASYGVAIAALVIGSIESEERYGRSLTFEQFLTLWPSFGLGLAAWVYFLFLCGAIFGPASHPMRILSLGPIFPIVWLVLGYPVLVVAFLVLYLIALPYVIHINTQQQQQQWYRPQRPLVLPQSERFSVDLTDDSTYRRRHTWQTKVDGQEYQIELRERHRPIHRLDPSGMFEVFANGVGTPGSISQIFGRQQLLYETWLIAATPIGDHRSVTAVVPMWGNSWQHPDLPDIWIDGISLNSGQPVGKLVDWLRQRHPGAWKKVFAALPGALAVGGGVSLALVALLFLIVVIVFQVQGRPLW